MEMGYIYVYICDTLNTAKYQKSVGRIGTRANTPNRRVIFCGIQGITYLSCTHAQKLILATTLIKKLSWLTYGWSYLGPISLLCGQLQNT